MYYHLNLSMGLIRVCLVSLVLDDRTVCSEAGTTLAGGPFLARSEISFGTEPLRVISNGIGGRLPADEFLILKISRFGPVLLYAC